MLQKSFMTLPDATIDCDGLAYAAGVLRPEFTDSTGKSLTRPFKGAVCSADATLVVHPIHNAAGDNYTLTLEAGIEKGFVFDYVVEDGGNPALNTLTLLPDIGRVYS